MANLFVKNIKIYNPIPMRHIEKYCKEYPPLVKIHSNSGGNELTYPIDNEIHQIS